MHVLCRRNYRGCSVLEMPFLSRIKMQIEMELLAIISQFGPPTRGELQESWARSLLLALFRSLSACERV